MEYGFGCIKVRILLFDFVQILCEVVLCFWIEVLRYGGLYVVECEVFYVDDFFGIDFEIVDFGVFILKQVFVVIVEMCCLCYGMCYMNQIEIEFIFIGINQEGVIGKGDLLCIV